MSRPRTDTPWPRPPALPPLEGGLCINCIDGAHRQCRDPRCECTVGAERGHRLHHTNRPRSQAPPRPKEDTVSNAAAAQVVPIDKPKTPPKAKPAPVPPVFGLTRVDELPPKPQPAPKGLADRVLEVLGGVELEDGAWYELITYAAAKGGVAASAAKRLSKETRLAGYDFAARGAVVYVRRKAT